MKAYAIAALLLPSLFCVLIGCVNHKTTTEVVVEVLRYFHDQELERFAREHSGHIFLARQGDFEPNSNKSLVASMYSPPSAEWLRASQKLPFSVKSVADCDFDSKRTPPFFFERATDRMAFIFTVREIAFPEKGKAVVTASAAFAPLAGGESQYSLEYTNGRWIVTDARVVTVF